MTPSHPYRKGTDPCWGKDHHSLPRPQFGPSPLPIHRRFALFGGWLEDKSYGWHAHLGSFATMLEVQAASSPYKVEGRWYQVVDLQSGLILEQGPNQ